MFNLESYIFKPLFNKKIDLHPCIFLIVSVVHSILVTFPLNKLIDKEKVMTWNF